MNSEVEGFLRKCNMHFLLDSFLAFGCSDRRCLEAVAKSGDAEIEKFIQTVIRRYPPARLLEDMQIWVLKQHFKSYAI